MLVGMLTTWQLKFTRLKVFTETRQETIPGGFSDTLCDTVMSVLIPHYSTETLTVIQHSSQIIELNGECNSAAKRRKLE